MISSKSINQDRFQFDPSDFTQFRRRVQSVAPTDPFSNCVLKEVLIHAEAIFQLRAVLHRLANGLNHVLLVMDKTTMLRDQTSLKPLVIEILEKDGFHVIPLQLESDRYGIVHPDFEQVQTVFRHIRPGVVVVGLGSGVIVDVCKYACFQYDQGQHQNAPIPFIFVATANSVPAYSSSMAIISKDGVKRTWPTRLPDAIICDLKVLQDCPASLNMGGGGDMCAMYIASLE